MSKKRKSRKIIIPKNRDIEELVEKQNGKQVKSMQEIIESMDKKTTTFRDRIKFFEEQKEKEIRKRKEEIEAYKIKLEEFENKNASKLNQYNQRRQAQEDEQKTKDKYIKVINEIQRKKTQEEICEEEGRKEFFESVKKKTEDNLKRQKDEEER